MRRAARVDSNHSEIVDTFEHCGCVVLSLASLGRGVPDLLVYQPRTGRFWLVEVKTRVGKLRDGQVKFKGKWPVVVVRTVDEVIELCNDRTLAALRTVLAETCEAIRAMELGHICEVCDDTCATCNLLRVEQKCRRVLAERSERP